MHDNHSSIR